MHPHQHGRACLIRLVSALIFTMHPLRCTSGTACAGTRANGRPAARVPAFQQGSMRVAPLWRPCALRTTAQDINIVVAWREGGGGAQRQRSLLPCTSHCTLFSDQSSRGVINEEGAAVPAQQGRSRRRRRRRRKVCRFDTTLRIAEVPGQ